MHYIICSHEDSAKVKEKDRKNVIARAEYDNSHCSIWRNFFGGTSSAIANRMILAWANKAQIST